MYYKIENMLIRPHFDIKIFRLIQISCIILKIGLVITINILEYLYISMKLPLRKIFENSIQLMKDINFTILLILLKTT